MLKDADLPKKTLQGNFSAEQVKVNYCLGMPGFPEYNNICPNGHTLS